MWPSHRPRWDTAWSVSTVLYPSTWEWGFYLFRVTGAVVFMDSVYLLDFNLSSGVTLSAHYSSVGYLDCFLTVAIQTITLNYD